MNQFKFWADKRQAAGNTELARRIRVEGLIASKLIREALNRGYSASVHDGEEWTVRKSSKKTEIFNALFTTDSDTIRFYGADGTIGAVFLVYGNDGYDVINDHTSSPQLNAIMEEVVDPYIDRMQ